MSTFSAPAKIILFGEHAVVYGYPAIAVPFSSLRATATLKPNARHESGLFITADDPNIKLQLNDQNLSHPLIFMAHALLKAVDCDTPPNVTVALNSHIPIASGLGSGAAIAAVLGRALYAAINHPLSDAELNQIVFEIEKQHHGTPSGIDNTVIVHEQAVYFVRDQPIQPVEVHQPVHLLVADTGEQSPTRLAVGDVRKLYDSNPEKTTIVFQEIGRLVEHARQILKHGPVADLGPLMVENHRLLDELTVSSPSLDHLVSAAINAGALGAKLSGGGRGGNMIALVTPATAAEVEKALLTVGAVRVHHTVVDDTHS
ncbi:MAG: mevalonate kinase [Anaerolineaceae bacterium]|nr:mevalonate kinase [Anaerolineaceae bacterium]